MTASSRPESRSCSEIRPRTDGVDVGSLALIFTVYAGMPGTSPGKTIITEWGALPGIGLCVRRAGIVAAE